MDGKKSATLPSGKKIKPLSSLAAIVLTLTVAMTFFVLGFTLNAFVFSFDYANEYLPLLELPIYTLLITSPALLRFSFFILKRDRDYWEKRDFKGLISFSYKAIGLLCVICTAVTFFFMSVIYNISAEQNITAKIIDKRWYYIRNNPDGARVNWFEIDPSFTGKDSRIEVRATTETFKKLKRDDNISVRILTNKAGLILIPKQKI